MALHRANRPDDGSQSWEPGAVPEDDKKPRVPRLSEWSSVMEELIEEAMRNGAFDDLPGEGKPLELSRNPYGAETELAFQLLKDNNYTLPWISDRNEIAAKVAALRSELRQVWLRHQGEYEVTQSDMIRQALISSWNGYLSQLQERIRELNRQIGDVNLKQPSESWEILKLKKEWELGEAGASETLG